MFVDAVTRTRRLERRGRRNQPTISNLKVPNGSDIRERIHLLPREEMNAPLLRILKDPLKSRDVKCASQVSGLDIGGDMIT